MRVLPPHGGHGRTVVLLALLHVYEKHGRATVRAVAVEADCSVAVAHHHLGRLREDGLATWENGCDGTLRPLVRRVA